VVIVPLHKELAAGTLASILRQAGISADTLKTVL
jgi:predicted RNA binding protein YcfA (HicA-like mRNA interferase family)